MDGKDRHSFLGWYWVVYYYMMLYLHTDLGETNSERSAGLSYTGTSFNTMTTLKAREILGELEDRDIHRRAAEWEAKMNDECEVPEEPISFFGLGPNPNAPVQCGPAAVEIDRRIAALENAMESIQDHLTRLLEAKQS